MSNQKFGEMFQNLNGFQLSRIKTKHMECRFRKRRNKDEGTVKLDDQNIPKRKNI